MQNILGSYRLADFDNFRCNACHRLKEQGDYEFLLSIIRSNVIEKFWSEDNCLYAFYLVGMVDFLSRKNGVRKCTKYNDIRKYKLEDTVYPGSMLIWNAALGKENEIPDDCIPEFLRFNIVEGDVYNVC